MSAYNYSFQQGQKWANNSRSPQSKDEKPSISTIIFDLDNSGTLDVTGKDKSIQHVNHTNDTRTDFKSNGYPEIKSGTNLQEWDTLQNWNKKINFDINADGTKERTEWLKSGSKDGILVMDADNNGKITGNELMNKAGLQGNVNAFTDGWQKARAYGDKNNDGKISGDELKKFSVWIDANGDGVTDPGELKTMAQLGITEINTYEGNFTRKVDAPTVRDKKTDKTPYKVI